MCRLPMLLLMLTVLGAPEKALALPIESKPVVVNWTELPGLRHPLNKLEIEGPPTFDLSGRLLCVTAHTWATNANFTQYLHYVILNADGVVQTSSESTPDTNLIAKFPNLAIKLFHRGVISTEAHTNMFLDPGRWLAASDMSWCIRVRQREDNSDLMEKFTLKPTFEKQWARSCDGEYGPPSCRISYVALTNKEIIAVSRSFKETMLLDAATGTIIDIIPYGPGQGIVSNLAMATCIIPQKGWLVCDEQNSRRIRVISLSPPHRILKEVGEKGGDGLGVWSTYRLESAAKGQLLLKVSHWGSRIFGGKIESTIYDTGTWKVLWRQTNRKSEEVALAPDGRRMAILKEKILEIRSFDWK